MKRDDQVDKGADEPSVIAKEIEAVDFEQVLAEDKAREASSRVHQCLSEKWSALQRSLSSIASDDAVEPADKVSSMKDSIMQFLRALRAESTEIAESITKSLSAVPAFAGLLPEDDDYGKGESAMTADEKKQLDTLTKSVADLTKQLEAATAKEPAKKAADLQEQLGKAEGEAKQSADELAKAKEDLTKAQAALAEATAKASMSDDEKKYMDALGKEDKDKFTSMSADDRKKHMSAKKSADADADPVVYKAADGTEFRKSAGDAIVSLAKRADESEKLAKAEREKRETAEFTKRAGEAPYKDFSGDEVEKVDVVRAISKMDEKARATLEKMLTAGSKAIAAAFETIGHKNETLKKSAEDFEKRVTEVASRDKISKADAMVKAREEYPEEFKAYNGAGN